MAWTAPTTRLTGDLITASIWNTDLTDNLIYLKTQTDLVGGISQKLIYKTVTETVNNSTVLQNDNELLFPILANEKWTFISLIIYNSSAVADFKLDYTIPAGASGKFSSFNWVSSGVAGEYFIPIGSVTNAAGAAADMGLLLSGYVANGATAGNVQFQWAQNTAEVSNTQVLLGSWILAHKVA